MKSKLLMLIPMGLAILFVCGCDLAPTTDATNITKADATNNTKTPQRHFWVTGLDPEKAEHYEALVEGNRSMPNPATRCSHPRKNLVGDRRSVLPTLGRKLFFPGVVNSITTISNPCNLNKENKMKLSLILLATLLSTNSLFADDPVKTKPAAQEAATTQPVADNPADAETIKNRQNARFGMFIHWGPVSMTGYEIGWSRGRETPIEEYDNLYKKFNPTKFDADQWVAVAKAAGMKYIVLTSKHHDGFCLWDTKQTDYNIMNSPFGRDVVGELAAACKKADIRFGLYHSTCDWHHPDFPRTSPGGRVKRQESDLDAYTEYLKSQSKELLNNYGPLFTLWYDVPQEFDAVRGQGVIDLVRTIQPNIMINNRTGAKGDYDTPEQKIGGFQTDRPWETCMTICKQWAWKPNDKMKSLEECLQTLVRTNGGDGNLLFNVGPMPSGEIEPRQVERLKEMGDWLSKNGESLYGTRGGPWKPTDAMVSTHKDDKVYLHFFGTPSDPVNLPALSVTVKSAKLLHGPAIMVNNNDGTLSFEIPSDELEPIDTIVELTLAGSAKEDH